MTLAPVIGGSERQGFGKYSLCSGKKEQDTEAFKRCPWWRETANTLLCIFPGQYLTVISIIMKNGQVNQINVISKPP